MAIHTKIIKSRIYKITFFSCILFIILTFISILSYPGEISLKISSHGYSFSGNSFCDLVNSVTVDGKTKYFSSFLFILATQIGGIAIILFFHFLPNLFLRCKKQSLLCIIGSLFGVFSGMSLMAMIISPSNMPYSDNYHYSHLFIITSILTIVIYAFVVYINKIFPKLYTIIFVVLIKIQISYVILIFYPNTTINEIRLLMVAEKICIFSIILGIMILAVGSLNAHKFMITLEETKKNLERKKKKYLSRVKPTKNINDIRLYY